jgi:hypothetical protein
MALQRRAREAPGAGTGGLDRSRGAGGLGAEGRSPRPHGRDPLRCRAQAHVSAYACGSRMSTSGIPSTVREGRARKTGSRSCAPCYQQTSWSILSGSRQCIGRTGPGRRLRRGVLALRPGPEVPARRAGVGGDSARPVLRPAGASVPFLSRRNGANLSFPAARSIDARSGLVHRHHLDEQIFQRAVKNRQGSRHSEARKLSHVAP